MRNSQWRLPNFCQVQLSAAAFQYGPAPKPHQSRSASTGELDEEDDSFDVVSLEEEAETASSSNRPAFPRLMTGADLLSGGGKTVDLPQGFQMGQSVRHPRYGLGVVVEVGGFGRRRTVTVEFQKDDRKETFIAAKCPLQPVSSQ